MSEYSVYERVFYFGIINCGGPLRESERGIAGLY